MILTVNFILDCALENVFEITIEGVEKDIYSATALLSLILLVFVLNKNRVAFVVVPIFPFPRQDT